MRIILASQSPRRRELLERMGVAEFDIIPAQGEAVSYTHLGRRRRCPVSTAGRPPGPTWPGRCRAAMFGPSYHPPFCAVPLPP